MKDHMTVSGPIRITRSQQELCGNRQSSGCGGSTGNPVTFLHCLHGITPALGGARAPVCSCCSSLDLRVLRASAVTRLPYYLSQRRRERRDAERSSDNHLDRSVPTYVNNSFAQTGQYP